MMKTRDIGSSIIVVIPRLPVSHCQRYQMVGFMKVGQSPKTAKETDKPYSTGTFSTATGRDSDGAGGPGNEEKGPGFLVKISSIHRLW